MRCRLFDKGKFENCGRADTEQAAQTFALSRGEVEASDVKSVLLSNTNLSIRSGRFQNSFNLKPSSDAGSSSQLSFSGSMKRGLSHQFALLY